MNIHFKFIKGLPKEDITKIKMMKRTLKNRNYAKEGRSKKSQEETDLETESRMLEVN